MILKKWLVSVIRDDLLAVVGYRNAVRADRVAGAAWCCDGGFCFLPLVEGGGSSLSGVGDCDSCCKLCLLWGIAFCRSLLPRTCVSAVRVPFGESPCGYVLWLYGVFALRQFAPRCLFVADSGLAVCPGLPRFRGGCCGWCCGFWCSILDDAASGISARLFSNCLTEPLIFPMRI